MIVIQNYINGQHIAPTQNQYFDNIEPATATPFSTCPDSDSEDIKLAITAAKSAFSSWSRLSIEERSQWLMRIADGIAARLEEFALAESMDNGKPLRLATQVDIPRAVSNFKFFAHAITQFHGESYPMTNVGINYTLRQPLGVVACISPWNLPLYLLSWKIAPALVSGNTVVAKPSEVTPYTAYLLSKVCEEIGLPAGVLNIVHGFGSKVGDTLCTHPDVKAISFTGGTATGKTIATAAAPLFKKLSLEMGGKNPNIIFADCNYDDMLRTTLLSSFSNQGQICLCGSRIYIERSLYERFKTDFVHKASELKVGDPLAESTKIGATVSKAHYEKILHHIEIAKQEGANILVGGHAVRLSGRCESGYFIAPTIIENLAIDCRTNQEEIFGPVVTITPFDTEEEVLAFANGTKYGLAASLWTENLTRAHRMAEHIESGIVWVNSWMVRDLRTPFGGVKDSGVGREGGMEALGFFTEYKNVFIKY